MCEFTSPGFKQDGGEDTQSRVSGSCFFCIVESHFLKCYTKSSCIFFFDFHVIYEFAF